MQGDIGFERLEFFEGQVRQELVFVPALGCRQAAAFRLTLASRLRAIMACAPQCPVYRRLLDLEAVAETHPEWHQTPRTIPNPKLHQVRAKKRGVVVGTPDPAQHIPQKAYTSKL